MAPEPRVVESSCLAASGISEELSTLHFHVLDMLSEVWTPSTRRLYAGSICEMMPYAHIDPATCSMVDVRRFSMVHTG